MQDLRFGSRLCGHRKEPFILTLIPPACVSHERPICLFEGGLRPAVSLFSVCCPRCVKLQSGEENSTSILF